MGIIKGTVTAVLWGLAIATSFGVTMIAEVSIGRGRTVEEYPRVHETHYPAIGRYQIIGKVISGCPGENCRFIQSKEGYQVRAFDTRLSEVLNTYLSYSSRRKIEKGVWRRYLIEVGGYSASIISIEPVTEEELQAEYLRVKKLKVSPPGVWKKEGRGLFKLARIDSSDVDGGSYLSSKNGGAYTTDFLATGSVWSEIFIGRELKSSRRILKTPQQYICWESMRIIGGQLVWGGGYSSRSAELGFHKLIGCRRR
jgi:hypothetical protein